MGAGCRIPPNATKLFYRWGMEERLRASSVKSRGVVFARCSQFLPLPSCSVQELTHGHPQTIPARLSASMNGRRRCSKRRAVTFSSYTYVSSILNQSRQPITATPACINSVHPWTVLRPPPNPRRVCRRARRDAPVGMLCRRHPRGPAKTNRDTRIGRSAHRGRGCRRGRIARGPALHAAHDPQGDRPGGR